MRVGWGWRDGSSRIGKERNRVTTREKFRVAAGFPSQGWRVMMACFPLHVFSPRHGVLERVQDF